MNKELKMTLQRIRKKIDNSSGCGYLYHHFDNMCSLLDEWKNTEPNDLDIQELIETLESYSYECRYCNYNNSLGWLKYSARSFYCADYLLKFIPDSCKSNLQYSLQLDFDCLMDSEAISFVDKELFDKYFYNVSNDSVLKERFYCVLKNSVHTASMHHPVEEDVEYMAYRGCKFSYDMIIEYIRRFDDHSRLKEWISRMNTPVLANIWYKFPDDIIRNQSGHRHMIERIEGYLDNSLELHLKLWDLWFKVNPKEVLDYNNAETLIDVLEVSEDESFIGVLNKLAESSDNQKVRQILLHFKDDDEDWIVKLSNSLIKRFDRVPDCETDSH